GIFHPSTVDPQTNYRYYTIDQFSLLDTIKFLRQLNIPLKEIKKYIDERNPAYALNLLEKQQEMMLKKQREIEYALAKMEHRIHLIKEATKAKAEQMVIKEIPQRKITAIAVAPNTTDDMFEYYIHSLQKNMRQMDDSLFSGDIGVTVAKKGLMQNEFQAYSSVFILLDYMPYEVHTSDEIKEGLYACSYHHGPYEETDATYKELLTYIDKEGYEVHGDSIEIG
ncbi:MerR family transcriptional regulator, partial [Bacillus cereus]